MPEWDEVAPCRDTSEARNTNPDGAPVYLYNSRHPYAFEVQERVIARWDEVGPCRDPGEARNSNPDVGTVGAVPPSRLSL